MGKIVLSLLILPLFLAPSFALEIPPAPSGYVNDYAGLLDPASKSILEEKLKSFEEATSNQVVVATFPSLGDENLEDFSIRLAQKWKIGQKGRDNGAILLIFKNDKKLRIEVGYGLEGALPDATSNSIIRNEIVARFKEGDFKGGIFNGVEAILKATKGEYQAAEPPPYRRSFSDWMATLFVFLVFGGIGYLILIRPLLGIFWPQRFPPLKSGSYSGGSSGWSTGSSWGGGSSSGGGGGFSGGGGSFGGGGSSGSW